MRLMLCCIDKDEFPYIKKQVIENLIQSLAF